MVVSRAAQRARTGRPAGDEPTPAAVVWHDLECGGYRVDLPLWRELADAARGPILELGAGTGRVALDLARAGHDLTALDRDPVLLEALRRRASGLKVQAVCADARSFALSRRDYGACLVPMQTLQLLGGAAGRRACMLRARAHLRPGGLLACALLSDARAVRLRGRSDRTGSRASSRRRAAVCEPRDPRQRAREHGRDRARAARARRARRLASGEAGRPGVGGRAEGRHARAGHVELDRVSAGTLEREGRDAGLRPLARRQISATDEHVGSVVVVLAA